MIRRPAEMATEERENMRGGGGTVSIRHFFKKDEFTANVRLCAELVLPPGAGIGLHEHGQEDEVYIITQGDGMLDDGTGERKVATGDAILTGNGASHAIRNGGDGDLKMVAVIACY